MSVEKMADGQWRVRWRDGGRNRSKIIGRKRDAEAFDAEVRRRRRMGELAMADQGKVTLADFSAEWWRVYAVAHLTPRTRTVYATLWDKHILAAIGGLRLGDLSPEHIDVLHADLVAKGLAPGTVRKCLAILQGVLQRAVEWRRIPSNPAATVRKPRGSSQRRVQPLAPATVEAIRAHFLRDGRLRDATIVSVLAYSGLRPGELRGLIWANIGERRIHVERAVSSDTIGPTKTSRARTVRLLAPLAGDLAQWRLAAGVPDPDAYVFPTTIRNRRREGSLWTDRGWNGWQQEHFKPTAAAVGIPKAVPYDLRHSFVSLFIQEGVSILDIARQAGHSPVQTLTRYGHLFDEFDAADRRSAEDQITAARGELVPPTYLNASSET